MTNFFMVMTQNGKHLILVGEKSVIVTLIMLQISITIEIVNSFENVFV